METLYFIHGIIITLFICVILQHLIKSSINSGHKKLPPGPTVIPLIGQILWFRKFFFELELNLKRLRLKYGPIITVKLSSNYTVIFIFSHSLAHKALLQNAAVFSDRPQPLPIESILSCNEHIITSATYGPTWRLLRLNLTAKIFHPSRVKSYSHARSRALRHLVSSVNGETGSLVKVSDHLQYAMFCVSAVMCFGDGLEDKQIKKIERVQRELLMSISGFNILNVCPPAIGKILFMRRWNKLLQLCQNQEDVFVPIIKARAETLIRKQQNQSVQQVAYVDTLLNLKLGEEGNIKLSYREMVCLCREFFSGLTDTTRSALDWIMANLIKYPEIQAKVYQEIVRVVGPTRRKDDDHDDEAVGVEDLQRMPYLKAVVLESLRRHPPAHFVMPHLVREEVELDGYVLPKNAVVHFMIGEMGRDPEVWDDPMEFKPERFLLEEGFEFDVTGSKEIKMMPFGAGRRICPGLASGLLHLQYFVANLVCCFEWKADHVDLTEEQVFTVDMKTPLLAHVTPRSLHRL